jgi:beta-lactamase class D OXA-42
VFARLTQDDCRHPTTPGIRTRDVLLPTLLTLIASGTK